jgi:4-carboxymuconolactone decarboxylase
LFEVDDRAIRAACRHTERVKTTADREDPGDHAICMMQARAVSPRLDPHAEPNRKLVALEYTEVLRRLAINDEHVIEDGAADLELVRLDPKTLALVRLAALVAVGGTVPSYGAETDAAIGAGATAAETVGVLVGVVAVVGIPSVVAAAPRLAMALGYDIDGALEHQSDW